jgi:hypothetical protein
MRLQNTGQNEPEEPVPRIAASAHARLYYTEIPYVCKHLFYLCLRESTLIFYDVFMTFSRAPAGGGPAEGVSRLFLRQAIAIPPAIAYNGHREGAGAGKQK